MIRVFVFEFTCAASAASRDAAGATALNAEGEAMLSAVLADFKQVPNVEAFSIESGTYSQSSFRAAARQADWSLVIAPEFNDNLFDHCRMVLEEGGRLLGPSLAGIKLCADKLALANHWIAHKVPTPPTFAIDELSTPPGPSWVVKPRFGAGSQETRVNGSLIPVGGFGPMIVQSYVRGRAASAAILCGPRAQLALPPVEQSISTDGNLQYLGGRLPLTENEALRVEKIARQAIAGIPDLIGYVGVDVVLGDDGIDYAIEINPRLTTSYIGLRALAESNLAEAMLRIAEGNEPPNLRWRRGTVEFSASGVVMLRA
jgi:predicted ATP-grasp superfamily ATP-dependent carboligase